MRGERLTVFAVYRFHTTPRHIHVADVGGALYYIVPDVPNGWARRIDSNGIPNGARRLHPGEAREVLAAVGAPVAEAEAWQRE